MRGLVLPFVGALALSCLYDVPPLATDDGGSPSDATGDLGVSVNEAGMACTCVPNVPTGWTLVSYAQNPQSTCPSGWGTPIDGLSDPVGAPATCSCSCNPTPIGTPTCTQSNATFQVTLGDAACANGTTRTISSDVSPGCQSGLVIFSGSVAYAKATGAPPPVGGCAAPIATEMIPPGTTTPDRMCSLQGYAGACTSTTICAPTPPNGWGICVSSPSEDKCPAEYPNKHVSGTMVSDTRKCSPCTCTHNGTCNTTLTFYEQTACGGVVMGSIKVDNTCQATQMTGASIIRSSRFTQQGLVGGNTCAMTSPGGPAGNITIRTPRNTICCR